MNFKIGQKVVAIKDSEEGIIKLKKGKIYTITDIVYHGQGIIVAEAISQYINNGFWYWLFKPLQYDIISNKDIIKEEVIEKADVEIKEPVKTE